MVELETCPTCKEPYSKPPTRRARFCSNGFHCCRDCVWDWQVEGGFAKGQRVEMCDYCKEWERKAQEEWERRHDAQP